MPLVHLIGQARASLELVRDIYVYGSTDEESVMAADTLRKAGYQSVAELQGGYAAWKASGFPVEG